MRRRVIATLSDGLHSEVGPAGLRSLRRAADGAGLVVSTRAKRRSAVISVKTFSVDGSLLGLWRKHVAPTSEVSGLDIEIPPDRQATTQRPSDAKAGNEAKDDDKPRRPPRRRHRQPCRTTPASSSSRAKKASRRCGTFLVAHAQRRRLADAFQAKATNAIPRERSGPRDGSARGRASTPARRRSTGRLPSIKRISAFQGHLRHSVGARELRGCARTDRHPWPNGNT